MAPVTEILSPKSLCREVVRSDTQSRSRHLDLSELPGIRQLLQYFPLGAKPVFLIGTAGTASLFPIPIGQQSDFLVS